MEARSSQKREMETESQKAGIGQGIVVVVAAFLPIAAIVSMAPAVPRILQHFSSVPNADTWVPLLVTAPGIMIALCSPIMGWLVDRYGRRRLLLVTTFVYGIFGTAPYILTDIKAIFVFRLAIGVTEAGILTITNTLLGDYFAHDQRRTWLTVQGLVGPLFGTAVLTLSGFVTSLAWNASFLIYAVAFPIFLAMLVLIYEPPVQREIAGHATGTGRTFPWADVVIFSLVTLFSSALYYVFIVQIGFAYGAVGVDAPERVGILISIPSFAVLLGALVFQRLSKRFLPVHLIAVFLGLIGLGMVGIGLSTSPVMMACFAAVQQIGAGMTIPVLVLWTITKLPAEHRGRGMGAWTTAFFLGQFISPLFVSAVRPLSGGILGTFTLMGYVAFSGAFFSLIRLRWYKQDVL